MATKTINETLTEDGAIDAEWSISCDFCGAEIDGTEGYYYCQCMHCCEDCAKELKRCGVVVDFELPF